MHTFKIDSILAETLFIIGLLAEKHASSSDEYLRLAGYPNDKTLLYKILKNSESWLNLKFGYTRYVFSISPENLDISNIDNQGYPNFVSDMKNLLVRHLVSIWFHMSGVQSLSSSAIGNYETWSNIMGASRLLQQLKSRPIPLF